MGWTETEETSDRLCDSGFRVPNQTSAYFRSDFTDGNLARQEFLFEKLFSNENKRFSAHYSPGSVTAELFAPN